MAEKPAIFTSAISGNKVQVLLEKIKRGEQVSCEERLKVIQDILAFSPRDWSDDPELWLLYRAALNNTPEDS